MVSGQSARRAQTQPCVSPEKKLLEKLPLFSAKGLVFHCHTLQNDFVAPTRLCSSKLVPVIS